MKVTERVWAFAQPVVESFGCTLWDVEYVREGGDRILRIVIDKQGGVDISDCEAVSRTLDPILDQEDPIQESYQFEVSSAGCERVLKRASDFETFYGSPILIKLYQPRAGAKEYVGTLVGYDDGRVTADCGGKTEVFEKSEVALVRLRVEF
ncbi:MAG: ribosome maturation factor RimP [Oscillospiraceae bacterium]|nr:ribosome maturation factor RimP [Oscillospiraceae bacterium]